MSISGYRTGQASRSYRRRNNFRKIDLLMFSLTEKSRRLEELHQSSQVVLRCILRSSLHVLQILPLVGAPQTWQFLSLDAFFVANGANDSRI